jgi:hypothetical protein
MRPITTHIGAPTALRVTALDEPGAGGANHSYRIGTDDYTIDLTLLFQNGGIKDVGVNGITNEALLAVVADRLAGFQRGEFACSENDLALTHIRRALEVLHQRTAKRIARGVEGKAEA